MKVQGKERASTRVIIIRFQKAVTLGAHDANGHRVLEIEQNFAEAEKKKTLETRRTSVCVCVCHRG